MRRVGIDVAVAANNHICDCGGAGIGSATIAGVSRPWYPGVFADTLPDPARHPLWLRKGDFRVALLMSVRNNGLSVPRGYTVNRIDTLRIRQDIAGARGNGATHVVLFLHWGNEYDVAESLAARLGRPPEPSLGGRSGDRFASARRSVGRNGIRFVGQDLRGDRFSMGNSVSNRAFSRYGRRHIGADRARRSAQTGGRLDRPEYLIHWTSISSDPGSRSGHRLNDIVPAYSRETVSPQQRPGLDRFVRRTRDYMQRYSRGFTEITDDYRKSGDAGTLPGD